jgi:surface protein
MDCYVNGVPVSASGIFPTAPSSSTFTDFKVGGNYLPSAWTGSLSGSIGQLMVYNRQLTDDEIYSDYLIQARRYSLPERVKPYTIDSSAYVYTQAVGITDTTTINAINTFVGGLKSASLWDKMIAIYPFLGADTTKTRYNLKDVSLNTTQLDYSGSWTASTSGSKSNNTSSYGILSNIKPTYNHPLISSQSFHMAYLSYDTPTTGGYAIGATSQVIASGGQIFDISGSRVHVFTSSANFTITQGGNVQALVVGGGGAGGRYQGGGGGAGGVISTSSLFNPSTYIITVGSGGLATTNRGNNGETSSFANFAALGGGGGGVGGNGGWAAATLSTGSNGGSGGGGGGRGGFGGAYISPGGTGSAGQGNSGAPGSETYSGGGGGAGTSGFTGSNPGGSGGSGSFYSQYSGTGYGFPSGWFAGGGGGGASTFGGTSLPGSGGIGGGGSGSQDQNSIAQSGRSNTGGGGGAGFYGSLTPNAGDGGSGIVIISYPINTGSSTVYIDPTFISASVNDTAGIGVTTGGPIGMITVSRTGSTAVALWKNKVPTKGTTRASASVNLNINLNSLNASNTSISSSQNNIAYASVGAGLTDSEVGTYYDLVDTLQTSLGRGVTNPGAFISTWDTRLTGSGTSNSSSVVLPLYGTLAITASWGDGTTSIISSSAQVDRTHSYATPGIYTVTITGSGQGFITYNNAEAIKLVDIGQYGSISGSTQLAFAQCSNLIGTAADKLILETTSLWYYFIYGSKFNGAIGNWDISKVTRLDAMLYGASTFNQPLGNWNTSNVTTMEGMFTNAYAFNQNIGSWNTSKVTSMNGYWGAMFQNAVSFNNGGSPSINNWDTSKVTSFASMFAGAALFNQPIGNWNISSSTATNNMFAGATSFNNGGLSTINNWNTSNVTNMDTMFYNAPAFNQPVGSWNTSNVTYMRGLFANASSFNQNIGSWNVGNVTLTNAYVGGMFAGATSFNNSGSNSINNWNTANMTDMTSMFYYASAFNQPLGSWNTSKVTGMAAMFTSASSFNQDIGSWDVSKVTNMSNMFQLTTTYNNSGSNTINNWRPVSCSNFNGMFRDAKAFNQPIGNWPLSASNIDMTFMFWNASAFNQNIGSWDTSKVTTMYSMFNGATLFNQNIGSWDTSNVTNMESLFANATAFNQDIGNWNVGKVTAFNGYWGLFMQGKTSANYSYLHTIYDGWINNKLQPNIPIYFNSIKYSGSAAQGRALLTRTYNTASITGYSNDGGQLAITCSSNHNVVAGNKIFISGSSFSGANGVKTVFATGSATTLTLTGVVYDPTATGGTVITGYGWSITDGGVVV